MNTPTTPYQYLKDPGQRLLKWLDLYANKVLETIGKDSVNDYNYIQEHLNDGDIRENIDFQKVFKKFYRMSAARLPEAILTCFWEIYEENRVSETPITREKMKDALHRIHQIKKPNGQRTVQFSFVTKMFHTLDPTLPNL